MDAQLSESSTVILQQPMPPRMEEADDEDCSRVWCFAKLEQQKENKTKQGVEDMA